MFIHVYFMLEEEMITSCAIWTERSVMTLKSHKTLFWEQLGMSEITTVTKKGGSLLRVNELQTWMRSQTVQFDKKRLAILTKIGGNILKLMEGQARHRKKLYAKSLTIVWRKFGFMPLHLNSHTNEGCSRLLLGWFCNSDTDNHPEHPGNYKAQCNNKHSEYPLNFDSS